VRGADCDLDATPPPAPLQVDDRDEVLTALDDLLRLGTEPVEAVEPRLQEPPEGLASAPGVAG